MQAERRRPDGLVAIEGATRHATTIKEASMDVDDSNRKVLNTTEAREGVTGHNVRYVLGFGLVGVVLAFVVAWVLAGHGYFGA
jgi:hypothetical protein